MSGSISQMTNVRKLQQMSDAIGLNTTAPVQASKLHFGKRIKIHHQVQRCSAFTQFVERIDELLLLKSGDTELNPGPDSHSHQIESVSCKCYSFDACFTPECPCKRANRICTANCECFEGNCNNMVSSYYSSNRI